MRASYSSMVREAGKQYAQTGTAFRVADLERVVGVQTYDERRKLRKATEELVRRKEFQRVERGLYRYTGKDASPQKQQVMWRFLRMHRSVTLEDVRVVLGVPEKYAQEWFSNLVKLGIVRVEAGGSFRLVKDSLDMPVNEEKAERLRKFRAAERISKIQAIQDILQRMRAICEDLLLEQQRKADLIRLGTECLMESEPNHVEEEGHAAD